MRCQSTHVPPTRAKNPNALLRARKVKHARLERARARFGLCAASNIRTGLRTRCVHVVRSVNIERHCEYVGRADDDLPCRRFDLGFTGEYVRDHASLSSAICAHLVASL